MTDSSMPQISLVATRCDGCSVRFVRPEGKPFGRRRRPAMGYVFRL